MKWEKKKERYIGLKKSLSIENQAAWLYTADANTTATDAYICRDLGCAFL